MENIVIGFHAYYFYAYTSFQILCHVCDAEQASCLYEQPLLYMNSYFKMAAMLISFDTW